MQLLKDLNLSRIAAVDIETVRIKEHYKDLSDQYRMAWQYKNKQDGVIPSEEELSDLWERTASLYAEFSKVCAISIAYKSVNKKGKTECMELFGENELDILNSAHDLFDRLKVGGFLLAAHAGKYFDYPYLCKRYVINGMEIPSILDSAHLKPWENTNICTNNDVWKMGGTGPGSSLLALSVALGLPISKADLVGDEVGSAYFEKKYKEIGRYCSLDAVTTLHLLHKIKGEQFDPNFDNVIYKKF